MLLKLDAAEGSSHFCLSSLPHHLPSQCHLQPDDERLSAMRDVSGGDGDISVLMDQRRKKAIQSSPGLSPRGAVDHDDGGVDE